MKRAVPSAVPGPMGGTGSPLPWDNGHGQKPGSRGSAAVDRLTQSVPAREYIYIIIHMFASTRESTKHRLHHGGVEELSIAMGNNFAGV